MNDMHRDAAELSRIINADALATMPPPANDAPAVEPPCVRRARIDGRMAELVALVLPR